MTCESAAGFGADQRDKTLKRRVPRGSRARADTHSPLLSTASTVPSVPFLTATPPQPPGPAPSPHSFRRNISRSPRAIARAPRSVCTTWSGPSSPAARSRSRAKVFNYATSARV